MIEQAKKQSKIKKIIKKQHGQFTFRKYVLIQRFRAILSVCIIIFVLLAHEILNEVVLEQRITDDDTPQTALQNRSQKQGYFTKDELIDQNVSDAQNPKTQQQIQDIANKLKNQIYDKRYKVYNYMYILQITFGICSSILYMLAKYLQYIQYKIIKIRTKLDSPFSGLNMYRSILYCILLNIQYRYTYGKLDNIKIQNLAWLNGPIYQYYSNIVDLVFFVNFSIHFFTIIYILIITSFVAKPCETRQINRHKVQMSFVLKYFYNEHLTASVFIVLFLIWFYFSFLIKVSENNLYRYMYYQYIDDQDEMLINALNNRSFSQFKNIIWFTFVTMSSIGYGEIFPYAIISRLFTGLLGIVALVLSSFLTVATTSFFMQDEQQKRSFDLFEQIILEQQIRDIAAKALVLNFKIIFDQKKKNIEHNQHKQKFNIQGKRIAIEAELEKQRIIQELRKASEENQKDKLDQKYCKTLQDSIFSNQTEENFPLKKDTKQLQSTKQIQPIEVDNRIDYNQDIEKIMKTMEQRQKLEKSDLEKFEKSRKTFKRSDFSNFSKLNSKQGINYYRSDQLTYNMSQSFYKRQGQTMLQNFFIPDQQRTLEKYYDELHILKYQKQKQFFQKKNVDVCQDLVNNIDEILDSWVITICCVESSLIKKKYIKDKKFRKKLKRFESNLDLQTRCQVQKKKIKKMTSSSRQPKNLFFTNQYASLAFLILPISYYGKYLLMKKEILKISYEEDSNRLFFLIKRSQISNVVVEVDKQSLIFNRIDYNDQPERFYYFFKIDFQDKSGNWYRDYDIWISDQNQQIEYINIEKLDVILNKEQLYYLELFFHKEIFKQTQFYEDFLNFQAKKTIQKIT